jgi:localization factor PodJL
MRYVPWHVKGVRPEVREAAREAARRSGLSVGAWLNSLIIDAAAGGHWRPASFDPRFQPTRLDDAEFAAIRKDIDELKHPMPRTQLEPEIFARRVHEIEARIDALQGSTRYDDVGEALRKHLGEFRDVLKETLPVEEIAKVWRHDLEEINATLGDAMSASVITALGTQVRALAERLEEHRGAEAATMATAEIEQALIGIRGRLEALTPAEELGELINAVNLLSNKVDSIATAGAAATKTEQLEHAIGALQSLASQVASRDVVAVLSREIKALSDKIDRDSRPGADSDFMNTLEERLAEIAEAVRHNGADEAASVPANLDAIIKALADRLEAVQISAAGEAVLKSFEQRIGALVEKLAKFDAQSERPDGSDRRMDELLAQLRELREQNESRLAAIHQQVATSAADILSGSSEFIRRDVASLKEIQTSVDRRTQDTFEAVYGTIEQMVDRLAVIEDELADRHLAPHPDRSADAPEWRSERAPPPHAGERRELVTPIMVAQAPTLAPSATSAADCAAPAPALNPQGGYDWVAMTPSDILPPPPSATTARLRHPAVPDFAADASLEPDSGANRIRAVADAIDRIAASEAVNGIAKAAETSAPVRAKFVAAARRAAQAVVSQHKVADPSERPGRGAAQNALTGSLFARLRPKTKSVVLGVSMVLLMCSALRLAPVFFHTPAGEGQVPPAMQTDDTARRGGEDANARLDETTPGLAPGWAVPPDMAAPAAISTSAPTQTPAASPPPHPPPQAGEGGEGAASSPMPNALLQGTADRDPASRYTASAAPDLAATPLPPTIGGKALVAAASAGDPSACYEIAMRFAQGRNTTPDLAMAAAWLERAARGGLAPAQFRLGSMYEKGLGVKKDPAEARRLYVAAAGKGHAKAMHNLAVLYAAGLDGKPDYAAASQWFGRAAAHGIIDSQYNLAILYARGVGIARNLAESYKWFALAAKGGDKDAARKRDEVAVRLDPKQLESAKLNAEAFVAVPQPDEATAIKAPAGGWDEVVAAATTKSKALVTPERFPGK